MLGDIRDCFWENFESNFELNYLLILNNLQNDKTVTFPLINSFPLNQKLCCDFYVKICDLIFKKFKFDNDLRMVYDMKKGVYNVYSIQLSNYFNNQNIDFNYDSFDKIKLGVTNNLNNDFSYILANFVRFNKNKKFLINDNERLFILTAVLEKFCFRNNNIKLKIVNSMKGSYIKLKNDILFEKLNNSYKMIMIDYRIYV